MSTREQREAVARALRPHGHASLRDEMSFARWIDSGEVDDCTLAADRIAALLAARESAAAKRARESERERCAGIVADLVAIAAADGRVGCCVLVESVHSIRYPGSHAMRVMAREADAMSFAEAAAQGSTPRPALDGGDAEAIARRFHEAYERLAPSFGYRTREASAVPWEQVPDANRRLMIATCAEVFAGSPALDGGEVGIAAVEGRMLGRSLADFEQACLVQIAAEQREILPDNSTIALLCDAVRLAREYGDRATASVRRAVADAAGEVPRG